MQKMWKHICALTRTILNTHHCDILKNRRELFNLKSHFSTSETADDSPRLYQAPPLMFAFITNNQVFNYSPHERKYFSGVQPTGVLHIGNYLGAIKRWTDLQNSGENVTFSIVDLHSITLPQNPDELRKNTLLMVATLLACGIDTNKSTLFLQSAVPQHTELFWVLSCLTTMAR